MMLYVNDIDVLYMWCCFRCSVLAAGAYIALCLNDHAMAYQHADKLLKQPRLTPAQK